MIQLKIAAGASIPEPQPPRVVASSSGETSSHYAVDRSNDRAYLAYGFNSNIVVLDGANFSSGTAFLELGAGSGLDFAPRVVPGPGGGAVFWYRNISGFSNQFLAQSFTFDGSDFVSGAQRAVTTSTVPPYAPAAAHVDGDVYVVAWSEGASPAFRIKLAFVSLP